VTFSVCTNDGACRDLVKKCLIRFSRLIKNSKVFINQYWKVYRWIVAFFKIVSTFLVIILVIITFAAIVLSVFTNAYPQTLILTFIFVILATVMNHLVG
jgi:hypothetical protein